MAGVRASIALGLWLWQAALSQAFGSDFAYGRALYVGDRTYFLVDTKPNAKAESSPAYILPNQVLVLDKESGEFYCQASDTCLSNSRSSIIISPAIIPTLVALDSSKDSGLPLLYKRYAFGRASTQNGTEMVAERNVRGQIGAGIAEEIDKKEWWLKSFNVFYELRLEAGQRLVLYKTPQISQKASQNVVLEIYAAPQPYTTSPEPLARAKAKAALLDERERAQILGDRVFLIGYEKGFYQAVVIVNESVYFWGYIDEAAIQALPANATQLDPSALPAFTKPLFAGQPTLQEMRQTHQKKIHTLLKPKPKDLVQMLTITVVFDTKSGRISLADSALLPYLPISQEIDYYLSHADRIKLADKAKSLGRPSINAALRMYIDMPSLSYLHLEPEVKLVRLELESSQSLQEPRLCIGGNLRYKRYLEVYADSGLSQLSTRIDKLDLALGELALLQTLPKAHPKSASVMSIAFYHSSSPPISGYIASDSISMCKDTDSSALPDYALAKTMLSIIENAEFKPIDSTTHALFHNKSSKGYRYTGLKSLKQAFAKANTLGLSPLELISLQHSSIDKSHKYGGDRFVSYDREGYNYPAQAHIVLLSEQEKATRILLIYPRETYLLSDNEAVFIAMGSLDFAK